MGRFVTILTWVLGVLLAAVIAVPLLIDWNQLKPWVENEVKNATGRSLTLAGQVTFSALPNPSLRVEDVTLANSDGIDKPLLQLDALTLNADWAALLQGQINFTSLIIEQPQLYIVERPNSKHSLDFSQPTKGAQGAASPPAAAPAANISVNVKNITLRGGQVTYKTPAAMVTLAGINASALIDTLNLASPLQSQASGQFSIETLVAAPRTVRDITAQFALADGVIKLNDVAAALGQARLRGGVSLALTGTQKFSTSLQLDNLAVAEALAPAPLPPAVTLAPLFITLDASGEVAAGLPALFKLQGKADIKTDSAQFNTIKLTSPRATIALNGSDWQMTNFIAEVFGATLNARGRVDILKLSPVSLQADASAMQLGLIGQAFGFAAQVPSGTVDWRADVTSGGAPADWLSKLNGRLTYNAKDVVLVGVDAARVSDQLTKLNSPSDFINLVNLARREGRTTLHDARGSLQITNGVGRTADTSFLVTDVASGTVAGVVDMARQTLSVLTTLKLLQHPDAPSFAVRSQGEFAALQHEIQAREMLAYLAVKLGKTLVREVEKAPERLKELQETLPDSGTVQELKEQGRDLRRQLKDELKGLLGQ